METNAPLVSVVMPVFNGETYIRQTIDSILTQTYRNIEFIILNDGSGDLTEQIILDYTDSRIRHVKHTKNMGLTHSLNNGISLSKGDYIARIDADDIADPRRIEQQVEFLLSHPDHGMCGTFYQVIDSMGNIVEQVDLPSTDMEAKTFLLFDNCFCHSSIMIKAPLIRELRYREEYQVCEDYDLWYRTSQRAKVSNIPVYATSYRIHAKKSSLAKKRFPNQQIGIINRNFLDIHHIPYSAEELEIHTNFLRLNCVYYESNGFAKLENWLLKLGKLLSRDPDIHQEVAHKIIVRRWITICLQARRVDCLIFNKFIFRYGFFYLECFYEKVRDKLLHRNPGYDF